MRAEMQPLVRGGRAGPRCPREPPPHRGSGGGGGDDGCRCCGGGGAEVGPARRDRYVTAVPSAPPLPPGPGAVPVGGCCVISGRPWSRLPARASRPVPPPPPPASPRAPPVATAEAARGVGGGGRQWLRSCLGGNVASPNAAAARSIPAWLAHGAGVSRRLGRWAPALGAGAPRGGRKRR